MLLGGGAGAINLTQGYPQSFPTGIVIDSMYVYWTNNGDGTVKRMPLGGAVMPTPVASSQASPSLMAIDATNAYWTEGGTGKVWTAPLSGTGTATSGRGMRCEAVDGRSLVV